MNNVKKEDELELVFPTKEHKQQVEEYLQEFLENGEYEIAGDGGLDRIQNFDEWLKKIQNDLSNDSAENNRIPSTLYLTIRKSDKKIVGNVQIRHYLNESLLELGGHIGYSIRPTKRGNGYNKINLYLGLKKCQDLGLEKVLITADDNNPASYRTIEALGGILENKVELDNKETYRRYWINVSNALKENKNKYEQTGKDL